MYGLHKRYCVGEQILYGKLAVFSRDLFSHFWQVTTVSSVHQEPVLKEGYLVKSPDVSKHLHVFKVCHLLDYCNSCVMWC